MKSNYFDRQKGLIVGAAIGCIGEIIIFISVYVDSHIPFMVGRAVAGLHGGLAMVLAPGLINELSPPHLRGVCGTLFSLGMAFGLIFASVLGLHFALGTPSSWHFLFCKLSFTRKVIIINHNCFQTVIAAGFIVFHGLAMVFVVESPRWLVDKGRNGNALKALQKLRSQ